MSPSTSTTFCSVSDLQNAIPFSHTQTPNIAFPLFCLCTPGGFQSVPISALQGATAAPGKVPQEGFQVPPLDEGIFALFDKWVSFTALIGIFQEVIGEQNRIEWNMTSSEILC